MSKVRFARVPTGAETCAFCIMLASRGFVYASAKTAGEMNHYHAHCDCMIVPGFGDNPSVQGYDPEYYYQLYKDADMARRLRAGNWLSEMLETKNYVPQRSVGAAANIRRVSENVVISSNQIGHKLGQHFGDFGLDVKSEKDRALFMEMVDEILNNADEVVTYDSWRSQPCPVTFYIKGTDVVVVNAEGHFVTILKDGTINNKRVINARAKSDSRP